MKKFMFIHKLKFCMIILFIFNFSITVSAVHAEIHHNTLTVDATDGENWVYTDLLRGEVVDISNAATSLNWDLGFRRTGVIVNGGISGPGEAAAAVLKDVLFEDILVAPEEGYVSDTEQITTFATGDGWYTYTGPPNHWVLPNDIVYILRTATGNYAKLRFIGYYEDNESKVSSGFISIEYVLQDDGTRNFSGSEPPADVVAKQKLATTWAALKRN